MLSIAVRLFIRMSGWLPRNVSTPAFFNSSLNTCLNESSESCVGICVPLMIATMCVWPRYFAGTIMPMVPGVWPGSRISVTVVSPSVSFWPSVTSMSGVVTVTKQDVLDLRRIEAGLLHLRLDHLHRVGGAVQRVEEDEAGACRHDPRA